MKLHIILIFLAGHCTSYKLYSEKSGTKGLNNFWADHMKVNKYSTKESNDALQNSTHTITNQRIFGGQQARPNSAPFLAGIRLKKRNGKKLWCGGSIISNKYILTAANCLDNASKATVILGAHDRLDDKEATRQTQTVKKKNFIFHESWNADKLKNDIALIKLKQNIKFTRKTLNNYYRGLQSTLISAQIQPIKLADSTFDDIDGIEAAFLGWGYFNTNSMLSQYVRFIIDILIPNTICSEAYKKYVLSTNVCLDGSSGKTACTGDMGGPLVIQDSDILIQVGIASFGSKEGCHKFSPSVFTRISKYFTWIQMNANL